MQCFVQVRLGKTDVTVPGTMPTRGCGDMPGTMPTRGCGDMPGTMPTRGCGDMPGTMPTRGCGDMPGTMPTRVCGDMPGTMPTRGCGDMPPPGSVCMERLWSFVVIIGKWADSILAEGKFLAQHCKCVAITSEHHVTVCGFGLRLMRNERQGYSYDTSEESSQFRHETIRMQYQSTLGVN